MLRAEDRRSASSGEHVGDAAREAGPEGSGSALNSLADIAGQLARQVLRDHLGQDDDLPAQDEPIDKEQP